MRRLASEESLGRLAFVGYSEELTATTLARGLAEARICAANSYHVHDPADVPRLLRGTHGQAHR